MYLPVRILKKVGVFNKDEQCKNIFFCVQIVISEILNFIVAGHRMLRVVLFLYLHRILK